jgi:hypothetical protein
MSGFVPPPATGSTFAPPTLPGFMDFIANHMNISTTALPSTSPWIGWAFNYAQEIVSPTLGCVTTILYALATYNLAADFLVNFCPDSPGQCVFATLREMYRINSFVPGVVQSTSDNGTSTSLLVPDFLKELTLSDLQELKTPYGRAYLAIAQKYGTLWGITC